MNLAQTLLDELAYATMLMRATARVVSRIPPKGRRGGAMAHRRWKKQRASGRA